MTTEQALAQWNPSMRDFIRAMMRSGSSIVKATEVALDAFCVHRMPTGKPIIARSAETVYYPHGRMRELRGGIAKG